MKNDTDFTIQKTESKQFYIVKSFAVLSVITAHVNTIQYDSLPISIATRIWAVFAQLGVAWFFILSGYFYRRENNDFKQFWKKKLFSLIIPWIVCSVLTYFFSIILGLKFSILGLFAWIVGDGSWYYFITVLLIFLLIFKYLNNKFALSIMIIINIISIALYDISVLTLLPYLNIFNWIGFFAIGRLIRIYRIDLIITKKIIITLLSSVVFLVASAVTVIIGNYGYFHILSFVFEIASFPLILLISNKLAKPSLSKPLTMIGEQTYFIYLIHMQIVQAIGAKIQPSTIKYIIYPFVAWLIMGIIAIGIKLIIKNNTVLKKCAKIIGMKV